MKTIEKTKMIKCGHCQNYFVGNDEIFCDKCQLKYEVKSLFLDIIELLKLDKFINWLGDKLK